MQRLKQIIMGNKISHLATKVLAMVCIVVCTNKQQAAAVSKVLPERPADTIETKTHTIKGVLSMYPDLPTGNLNVKWENQPKGIANVLIMDTADIEVLRTTIKISTPSGNTQIDLSALKLGDYTIIVNYENKSITGRLSVVP